VLAWYDAGVERARSRGAEVYEALRARIVGGQLAAGTQLPPHLRLAAEFGVAPMTVREALRRLEDEGLVSRQHGRGTFVRDSRPPAVLVVDDEEGMRALLSDQVEMAGYRAVSAAGPAEAIVCLEDDPSIALVLADVRMPTATAGIELIRVVRRRWPRLPLAAVTAYPEDLVELYGTPECPVLILAKPFRPGQIDEALELALGRRRAGH
jgi:CheY-like chemotaxis protein